MKKKMRILIFLVFFASGFSLLVYPNIRQFLGQQEILTQIKEFDEADKIDSSLYDQMQKYNQRIYTQSQKSLKDAWSYQKNEFDFSELNMDSDMIGYVSIDAMNIQLPLYVGASKENMDKGAVVLGQTSMPIGGENTNCVIAAHRGTYTSAMFRDIENLNLGDVISITNPWETLEYEVIKCVVISPDDIEAVKIRKGADMITLITCHPYPKDYQRYVIYAQRKGTELVDINPPEQAYTSSQDKLHFDKLLNRMGILFFTGTLFFILVVFCIRKCHGFKKTSK